MDGGVIPFIIFFADAAFYSDGKYLPMVSVSASLADSRPNPGSS